MLGRSANGSGKQMKTKYTFFVTHHCLDDCDYITTITSFYTVVNFRLMTSSLFYIKIRRKQIKGI